MKHRLDTSLLYEIASINIVEAEIKKLKRLRETELFKMQPKEVGSVDYEKEKVQGGMIESEEQQILNIQSLTAQILQQEQLLNIYNDTLQKKNEAICSVLTERERIVYLETFIKGRSCETVANELGYEPLTIIRDRKAIMEKINSIKANIRQIKSEIIENM